MKELKLENRNWTGIFNNTMLILKRIIS